MKLLKNYLYNMSYQLLIIILPLILAPYISRVIGPEGVGVYSYSYSIVTLFGLFANLGIAKYGNREIAKCGDDRKKRSQVFWEIIFIKLLCSVVVFLGYFGYLNYCVEQNQTAFYFQIFNLLSFVVDISWFYWGTQNFKLTALNSAIMKVLSIVAIFMCVKTKSDTYLYVGILSFSAFLIQFSLWFYLPRYIDFQFHLQHVIQKHWKHILLLFLPVFAKYIYNSMDRIMLGSIVNMEEVGYYENVQSITLTITNVLTALGDVVMPQMTLLYAQKNHDMIENYTGCAFHLITFLAIGAMFGFIGVADTFIPMFYGDQFHNCIKLLQLIAPTIVFVGYSDLIRNLYLLPKYKDREYVVALIFGAIVNFGINAFLIPHLQSVGAIIGTLFAEFSVMFLQAWLIRKDVHFLSYMKKTLVYCMFGFVILISSSLIQMLPFNMILNCLLQIAIGGSLYALCVYWYLNTYEKAIWNTMKIVLHRG